MPQSRAAASDFTRAFGDAKKQAGSVAGEVSDAAQDLYDHAADSASDIAELHHAGGAQDRRLLRACVA